MLHYKSATGRTEDVERNAPSLDRPQRHFGQRDAGLLGQGGVGCDGRIDIRFGPVAILVLGKASPVGVEACCRRTSVSILPLKRIRMSERRGVQVFSPSAVPSQGESTHGGGCPLRGNTLPVHCRTFDTTSYRETWLHCRKVPTHAALVGVLKAVDCREMGAACLGQLTEPHQPERRFVAQPNPPDFALQDALRQCFVLFLERNVLSHAQDTT